MNSVTGNSEKNNNSRNIFTKFTNWCKHLFPQFFSYRLLKILLLLFFILLFFICIFTVQQIKNDNLIKKIKSDTSYNLYTLKNVKALSSINIFKTQNNEVCIVSSGNICFFDSNKYSLKCQKTKIHIPHEINNKVSGAEIKNNLYLLICGNLYKINNKTKKIVQISLNHKLSPNSKLFQINTSELFIIDTYAIYTYNTENNSLIKTDKSIKNKRENFEAIKINKNQIFVIGANIPTFKYILNDSNKIYYKNQIYNIEKKNTNGDIIIKKDNALETLVNSKNTYELFENFNNGEINQHIGNIDLKSENFVRLQNLPSGNVFVLGNSDATIFNIKTRTQKKIHEDSFIVNAKSCVPVKLNNGNLILICDNKNNKDNNSFEKIIIEYDENQNKFKIQTKLTCIFKNPYGFIQGIQLPDGNILLTDIVPKILTLEK